MCRQSPGAAKRELAELQWKQHNAGVKTKINLGILAAWLLHAIAWFLPVEKNGVRFPKGLPGWEAFRVACYAIWPDEGLHYYAWRNAWHEGVWQASLATASAITTVLFLFGSPWVVLRGSFSLRRVSAWIAMSAFVINTHWYVLSGSASSAFGGLDLRVGYFLWCLSFVVLALGLFVLVKRGEPTIERLQAKSAGNGLA
jgi:hypothetical protein